MVFPLKLLMTSLTLIDIISLPMVDHIEAVYERLAEGWRNLSTMDLLKMGPLNGLPR